jgi:acyl carrier protein
MEQTSVSARVMALMSEMFELDAASLTPETRLFEDLDLDSLDAIDMVVRLQEMTGRRVDEAALKNIRTVQDVIDVVETHLTLGS